MSIEAPPERNPLRLHLCRHPRTLSITIKADNRHVSLSAYPTGGTCPMIVDFTFYNLTRQDIIDLAHRMLEAALATTDPDPEEEEQKEV